jgi:hypothetical protein
MVDGRIDRSVELLRLAPGKYGFGFLFHCFLSRGKCYLW